MTSAPMAVLEEFGSKAERERRRRRAVEGNTSDLSAYVARSTPRFWGEEAKDGSRATLLVDDAVVVKLFVHDRIVEERVEPCPEGASLLREALHGLLAVDLATLAMP